MQSVHSPSTDLPGSSDQTVRIRDPDKGKLLYTLSALAVAWDEELGLLFIGTETGLLAIRLDVEDFRRRIGRCCCALMQ